VRRRCLTSTAEAGSRVRIAIRTTTTPAIAAATPRNAKPVSSAVGTGDDAADGAMASPAVRRARPAAQARLGPSAAEPGREKDQS